MAGSIEQFYGQISKYNDFARANRFDVSMSVPKGLTGKWSQAYMDSFSFLCESAELPGKNLATIDRRTYGVSEKLPVQTVYQDITLTMICTDDKEYGMWQKIFFEDWMQYIHPDDTYNFRYKNEYVVDFVIKQYSVLGDEQESTSNALYAVKIYEAYPINMNQLGLNWAEDGFLRLSMTFAYTKWERVYGKRNTISLQQNLDTPYLQLSDIPSPEQTIPRPPLTPEELNAGFSPDSGLPTFSPF